LEVNETLRAQRPELLREGEVLNDQFMMSPARQSERSDEKTIISNTQPILICFATKINRH